MNKTKILQEALEAGFMFSTAFGQEAPKLMPVTDTLTILGFAKRIAAQAWEEGRASCDQVVNNPYKEK